MERKLVSFKQIDSIIPHPNADLLELAIIGGWQCIVEKGKFKEQDWVIYFEIDSLIPISEEFEFLRKYCYVSKTWMQDTLGVSEGFRIRSLKLRGELSQGLIIPIPINFMTPLDEEANLTNEFGVVKWESPENIANIRFSSFKKGAFPSFIPKTGETRIQNSLSKINKMRNELFECTRKYHGSSITFYAKLEDNLSFFQKLKFSVCEILGVSASPIYKYGVCSHNTELDLNKDNNLFVAFANNSGIMEYIKDYVENSTDSAEIAIQGEICGPGIQDNHHGLEEVTVFIFNIYDIKNSRYLLPKERWAKFAEIFPDSSERPSCIQEAVLEYIRPIGNLSITEIISLGEYTLSSSGKDNEGLVWKALYSDFSFKAISNKFLLNCKN